MIERHISLDVLPGRGEAFVRLFTEEYRPAAVTFEGLIECSLLREVDSETRFQMVFRWETAEQAVRWRTSEVHQDLQPALEALHEGMTIVAYARVV